MNVLTDHTKQVLDESLTVKGDVRAATTQPRGQI